MNQNIGQNVTIKEGVIIGDNVTIEDDVYIDHYSIIRDHVTIKKGTVIGANCILGEVQADFYAERQEGCHPLLIGENSIIRSGSIIYGDTVIGQNFQTGHRVTVREHAHIGSHVSLGTLSDIQGYCEIGDYVRMHSNVHIGQQSVIKNYVWIFPYVVLTNDPTPPSEHFAGVTVHDFAVIATGSVLLPGVNVDEDTLVAAGAVVTKNVERYSVVGGNPAKVIADIRNIKNHFTGEKVYPWRDTFERGMPWEGSGYQAWLEKNEEKAFGGD